MRLGEAFDGTVCNGFTLARRLRDGVLAAMASAQEAAAAAAADEIIVTATRRTESLQNVPASITAFNDKTIQAAGIVRPADFIGLTPNVNLVQTQNAGTTFVIIRGITQARNSEPSVAVVVDGVQQVNAAQFNQELVDVEQIEVLKGPQGGLYGRNAIGGAIIITSKAPTDELSGKFTGGVDNGFGYFARANLSGPIAENVKFRIASTWYDTNGFIPNTFLNEDADPFREFNLRGNLLWTPTPELTVDLRGSVGLLRTQAFYYNIVNDVNDVSLPVRVNNAGINNRDLYNATLRIALRKRHRQVHLDDVVRQGHRNPHRRRLQLPADQGIVAVPVLRLRSQPEPVSRRRGVEPGTPL